MAKLVLARVPVEVEIERLVPRAERLTIVLALEGRISTVIEEALHVLRRFGRSRDQLTHASCALRAQDDSRGYDGVGRQLLQGLEMLQQGVLDHSSASLARSPYEALQAGLGLF
jgi:hypothetical protein